MQRQVVEFSKYNPSGNMTILFIQSINRANMLRLHIS